MRSEEGWFIGAASEREESQWIQSLRSSKGGTLYIPIPPDLPEPNTETARFIGKIGIEALAARCQDVAGCNAELVNHPSLDELRNYVRLGVPNITWPVAIRRIYDREHRFSEFRAQNFEVLHEWMILRTIREEYYCVVAIFGIEFAINLGGPELDGWNAWLGSNGGRSPLLDAPTSDGGVSR